MGSVMKGYMLKGWLIMVVSLFTSLSPASVNREFIPPPNSGTAQAAHAPRNASQRVAIQRELPPAPSAQNPDVDRMALTPLANTYTYVFSGVATVQGQPCANAKVAIRLSTPKGEEVRNILTRADGSYSVTMSLTGAPDDPVRWEIQALSPNFQSVNLDGRLILLDQTTVTVEKPLNFAAG